MNLRLFGFVLLVLTMVTFAGCQTQAQSSIPFKESFLVDVRTPSEFAEGSVKGAVNIPLQELESRIEEFKDKKQVVLFCRSGNRASQAQTILKENGIANTLNGGSWTSVNQVLQSETKKQ